MNKVYLFLIPIITYFIGAIPFGVIIGHFSAGIDITKKGSGNTGATNVARTLGIKYGLLTLLLDALKGFLPVFFITNFYDSSETWLLITVSLALLLGHRFSPFLKFRGGKGVATAFGIYIALSPVSVFFALCIFTLLVYLTDYVSLGSVITACIMPLIFFFTSKPVDQLVTASFIALIICLTHKKNLIRLIEGKERRWKNRKS